MFSSWKLKDGQQVCFKCEGQGCYWCRRQGTVVQCPVCKNHEHELITKNADGNFNCGVCGEVFSKSGTSLPKDS